jgi:hypothetical protein
MILLLNRQLISEGKIICQVMIEHEKLSKYTE